MPHGLCYPAALKVSEEDAKGFDSDRGGRMSRTIPLAAVVGQDLIKQVNGTPLMHATLTPTRGPCQHRDDSHVLHAIHRIFACDGLISVETLVHTSIALGTSITLRPLGMLCWRVA
jgi:hypothetical protein